MKGIIDRFEENFAVVELEDNTMQNIPKELLPREAEEGTVIIIDGERIYIDKDETLERKKRIDELFDELFN
ncbi:Protein of unknown function [Proteiniborus ethanoligenes]|uniref:DUF3006 domain-containing protein n=1 Tax=Proteiniborus ethanoligenes TaxID=415015 RepID=A0A1H3Q067_9FIRM|nr:DUF3006 domain-containing protein [Proteiniborus ethanoligenes]TAH62883.1 MAG: DUF3006 domain-containing protein [Gottschalkiaceae bacterium]SDZ06089.1 Protein of unknown function [Proteiniborus ethanoligenes]